MAGFQQKCTSPDKRQELEKTKQNSKPESHMTQTYTCQTDNLK